MMKVQMSKWNKVIDLYYKESKSVSEIAIEINASAESIKEIISIYKEEVS